MSLLRLGAVLLLLYAPQARLEHAKSVTQNGMHDGKQRHHHPLHRGAGGAEPLLDVNCSTRNSMAFLASPTLGAAYAALLLAGPDSTDGQKLNSMQASGGGFGHAASRQTYLNRTICFQNRLRDLNSSYPLVVIHDFDDDLSPFFDQTVRVGADAGLHKGSLQAMHMNKLLAWALVDYERVLLLDSDIYMRVLPDALMTKPFEEGKQPLMAVPNCAHGLGFNSGVLMLKPNLTTYCAMRAWRGRPQHACTGNFFGDQAFLNTYWGKNYTHLEHRYNAVHKYTGRPVKVQADENVHFTGSRKPPWHLCQHETYV